MALVPMPLILVPIMDKAFNWGRFIVLSQPMILLGLPCISEVTKEFSLPNLARTNNPQLRL
jgi:hypothetical protein